MRGELALPMATLYSFLLVLSRVGGALLFVPLPGLRHSPEVARIVLALACTLALFPAWPRAPAVEADFGRLLAWMFSEVAFGVTVGLAVAFLNEAFLVASQVFGLQAGYSYAATIDPSTEADSNVLLVFAQFLAGLLFFSLGLDRQVLRVFARSLEVYPPGAYAVKLSSAGAILGLGADMFSTGLRLAMPVVALLLLVDISLSLLGRIHAQLQLLTLAFPAKMLGTLALLAALSGLFLPVYQGLAERTFSVLMGILRSGG